MMSSSDIETAASLVWGAVYSLRFELICVFGLCVLWIITQLASSKPKRPTLVKNGSKYAAYNKSAAPKSGPAGRAVAHGASSIVPFEGRVDSVDPALLQDPSWIIPQVIQLCRTQVAQARSLYRASIQSGLKLQDLPAQSCKQLFEAMITASIRANQVHEIKKLFSDLQRCGLGVIAGLFASTIKLCTSKQLYAECLEMYDFMKDDQSFSIDEKAIWSCLLFSAMETKSLKKCSFFFEQVKRCGTPSAKDFGNMVRVASLRGDWELSLSLIQSMRDSGVEIDAVQFNTVLATCVASDKVDKAHALLQAMESVGGIVDVITYNTIMKGYSKAGNIDGCFEALECASAQGIAPSQVTYGILLDCCINENQLDRAADVFNTMTEEKCPMNTVLYTTLIKGFSRAGKIDQAMTVYKQMRADPNVTPDLITFSILIKAHCDAGNLEESLKSFEEMINLGLRPDEVVFNNLLAGCAQQANARLGEQLYIDMVASGVKPSNATFSILIRMYQQCKLLEEAVAMLGREPAKHNVEPEPRLFLQLMQSCIRDRQGKRAIEVYEMLSEYSIPTASAHSSLISTCVKLNMYDTAVEILSLAAGKGAHVDERDSSLLIEGAFKKGKTRIVQDCAAAMRTMGHAVNPKFAEKSSALVTSTAQTRQRIASPVDPGAPWKQAAASRRVVAVC